MNFQEYTPSPALASFIKSYRFIKSADEMVNRVLPGTTFTAVFQLKGKVSLIEKTDKIILPAATLSGLRKGARLINYAPDSLTIIIHFRETGIAAFFKQPAYEFFEESLALDDLFATSEISIIEEQLAEASDYQAIIKVIESFLVTKLLHKKEDLLINEAVSRITSQKGSIRIEELSKSLFISQDAFEKRFRKLVGVTPKQFSSIVKINTLIRQRPPALSLTHLALESGYYDQAHFNKDFKLFTGQTPTDFFKAPFFW
ncbi:AraC family transcriptional regulator [Chitinophaga silvatica]|uniref:AraC family transcriptional regulator n=1 Tax=Chitinophaga silvatica TaxID=2282649 RepID=A0A3E1YCJ3_9BACT|nr:helix-turn-helix domain-containing protein [Chitinophaga silvatica]RFS23931.1 AraC family transcriptional regulator [Chitinophaga silvatica]